MISEAAWNELREENRRLLARRLRGMLWIVVLAISLFAVADLSVPPAHPGAAVAKVYALYGLQMAITFALLGAMYLPSAERWASPLALMATAEVSLMVTALGFVSADAMTGPLIAIVLTVTTASLFPWGAVPQAMTAAMALAGVFWNVLQVGGRHDEALAYPIIVASLSSIVSVYMAFEFERSRLEAKRAQQDLARARDSALESSRLQTSFLANISHEIRTPINVMLGFSNIIADDLKEIDIDRFQPYVDEIASAAARLLATVDGILDLAQLESGTFPAKPRPLDLRAVIDERIEELRPRADAKGLSLTTLVEEPDAVVVFDQHGLSRALTNLLDNAIKFTDQGGVQVRLWRERSGAVCVEVADTGIGMAAVYAARLFNAFSQEDVGPTRRYEGTGIGLALVERFLKLGGATIGVESDKGKGSRFRITFPVAPR